MGGAARALATVGSIVSIGFGIWHLFVPGAWHWSSYIEPSASELILAVHAVNLMFSLSLVLFGAMNVALVWSERSTTYAAAVALTASGVLWSVRVALQLVYPQGTLNPVLQYSMLGAFVGVTLCFLLALGLVLSTPPGGACARPFVGPR